MAVIVLYLALWILVEVAWAIPPPNPQEWLTLKQGRSLNYTDDNSRNLQRRGTTFKHLYVHYGVIYSRRINRPVIEVSATLSVSDYAHQVAALTIARMLKHMPQLIFRTLSIQAKVGVFTKAETLTIYPEYAFLASPPGCESSCNEDCRDSCTFDGRKYISLAGAGGIRAVVIDSNVLCNDEDLYKNQSNILVHEFAHTIHKFGLTRKMERRISSSYANAKAQHTWEDGTYAMATEQEYFAMATQSYFAADKQPYSSGGMNICGHRYCQSEADHRQYIEKRDPKLYAILTRVYTNNRPSLLGNIGTCTNPHA